MYLPKALKTLIQGCLDHKWEHSDEIPKNVVDPIVARICKKGRPSTQLVVPYGDRYWLVTVEYRYHEARGWGHYVSFPHEVHMERAEERIELVETGLMKL